MHPDPTDPTDPPETSLPPDGREPQYRNGAFTFEGQIERLQHWVVGINRRGGRDKRLVKIAVIAGLALLLLAYFSGIFWGLFL